MRIITTTPQSSSSSRTLFMTTTTTTTAIVFSKPKFLYKFLTTPFCTKSSSSSNASIKLNKKVKKVTEAQLTKNYLASLSCPFVKTLNTEEHTPSSNCCNSSFVVGVDPDGSGALAVLKLDHTGSLSPQVFDSPHLKIMVGGRVRKRLDTKAIVQLLHSIDAPSGTTAYIEQSTPYPKDGKQGWYSGGFTYGLWIGILVASGYSVVPVPSATWKKEFELSGNGSTKDNSRMVASMLFPSMSSQLTRKKDHGRAEALLIAAYGQGLKAKSDSIENLE